MGPSIESVQTMRTHQHYQQKRDRWARLQRILFSFIILCVVGILVLLLIIGRTWQNENTSGQHPTPSPIVSSSPIPTQTPKPTVTATPSPTPKPTVTPTPPPGVLTYPLYSGNPNRAEIALTFDDGPSSGYTAQILQILQRYGVTATFNVIGENASAYPDLIAQESQQGYDVGNHTWTHPELIYLTSAQVRAQLLSTSNEIQADTGTRPGLFRPPYGEFNSSVQADVASLGLSTIMWSVDPKDWSQPGIKVIIQRVLSATHNGSIILMHDGGGNRSETVAALPAIITTLQQRGFHFVSISDMIHRLPSQGTGPTRVVPDSFTHEWALRQKSTIR